MELTDKIVLVTGASRGLGAATALACAQSGASLFLVDRDPEGLYSTQTRVAELGARCEVLLCDLAERQSCFDAVAAAVDSFGHLDALCNVAGIVQFHRACDVTAEDWNRIIAVNLSAPFYLSQAAIPELIKRHGSIVNVASAGGINGAAYIVPYSVSKAGLIQMTKSMAMEFIKEPIRINAIAPGTMDTKMNENVLSEGFPAGIDQALIARYSGFRPWAAPKEMANMIVYMLTDATMALHGAIIAVDGGITTG